MKDLNITGFFNPTTGEKDKALFRKFIKYFTSQLKCDGILSVSIDTVLARVSRSRASWDGVSRNIETMGSRLVNMLTTACCSFGNYEYIGLEGTCTALSLVATIYDKQGNLVWEGRGGIHVLEISKAGGLERLHYKEVIGNHKRNQKAVDIAFKSLIKK
jgi:hypothetical protein